MKIQTPFARSCLNVINNSTLFNPIDPSTDAKITAYALRIISGTIGMTVACALDLSFLALKAVCIYSIYKTGLKNFAVQVGSTFILPIEFLVCAIAGKIVNKEQNIAASSLPVNTSNTVTSHKKYNNNATNTLISNIRARKSLKEPLSENADPNVAITNSYTHYPHNTERTNVLHYVISAHNADAVRELLKAPDIDPNLPGEIETPPIIHNHLENKQIHNAFETHGEIFYQIIDHPKFNLRAVDKHNCQIVHHIVVRFRYEPARLIEKNDQLKELISKGLTFADIDYDSFLDFKKFVQNYVIPHLGPHPLIAMPSLDFNEPVYRVEMRKISKNYEKNPYFRALIRAKWTYSDQTILQQSLTDISNIFKNLLEQERDRLRQELKKVDFPEGIITEVKRKDGSVAPGVETLMIDYLYPKG